MIDMKRVNDLKKNSHFNLLFTFRIDENKQLTKIKRLLREIIINKDVVRQGLRIYLSTVSVPYRTLPFSVRDRFGRPRSVPYFFDRFP